MLAYVKELERDKDRLTYLAARVIVAGIDLPIPKGSSLRDAIDAAMQAMKEGA